MFIKFEKLKCSGVMQNSPEYITMRKKQFRPDFTNFRFGLENRQIELSKVAKKQMSSKLKLQFQF